jgi:hypothetical protein
MTLLLLIQKQQHLMKSGTCLGEYLWSEIDNRLAVTFGTKEQIESRLPSLFDDGLGFRYEFSFIKSNLFVVKRKHGLHLQSARVLDSWRLWYSEYDYTTSKLSEIRVYPSKTALIMPHKLGFQNRSSNFIDENWRWNLYQFAW